MITYMVLPRNVKSAKTYFENFAISICFEIARNSMIVLILQFIIIFIL